MKSKKPISPRQKILDILKDHPAKVGELERGLNKSRKTIESTILFLQKRGHQILWDEGSRRYHLKQGLRTKFEPIAKDVLYTDKVVRKMGISETHIGGRHSQPHFVVLCVVCLRNREFGKIDLVCHYGDVHNGLKHQDYNRGENILNTVDLQVKAANEVMGLFENIPVFIKSGDHDDWQMTAVGTNMVKNLVNGLNLKKQVAGQKPSFSYISPDNGDQIQFNGFVFEFKHITTAQSRGLTTKPQYMFEDRLGDFVKALREEDARDKGIHLNMLSQPDHIGFGNWHREISFFHGGTAMDLYPGFQASTGWEKSMGIVHKFGAKIITLGKDKFGNVFRYDVRYLDFSDEIVNITKSDLETALMSFALKTFYDYKKKLLNVSDKK
ncbi:MAG: hypothetical protein A2817_02435 [Candidatus Yanofskybacteria bacterium RIFCSPHIGHO2_01_FULL_39_8b]|uniref:Uncharacterized protein n=1 Tax=Candidatus Yanofskybacteria bacterium RIFCSPHIGHO2_01_FULL_39_8b TaxID=1802659 RepID=A0A1F8E8T8_9BACT|nr:hypothetical protein [uncultured bacterium]OGM97233.1 MAG: hypothetical protein A2817_02435 [Candidatus Yanofskybacteria bacterium RIFCSPHIGHO2_01_FULL_39_8b]